MGQRARCDVGPGEEGGCRAVLTSMMWMSALVKSMFSRRGSGTPWPSTAVGQQHS